MTYTIKFTTPFDQIEHIKVEAKTMQEAIYKADKATDICEVLSVEEAE
jgi:hypothetical protein